MKLAVFAGLMALSLSPYASAAQLYHCEALVTRDGHGIWGAPYFAVIVDGDKVTVRRTEGMLPGQERSEDTEVALSSSGPTGRYYGNETMMVAFDPSVHLTVLEDQVDYAGGCR